MEITIAGIGPGDTGLITEEAKAAVSGADTVICFSERARECVGALGKQAEMMKVSEVCGYLAERVKEEGKAVICASGDTGFFSVAGMIVKKLEGAVEPKVICGISSMQYFAAKARVPYDKMKSISLHGRDGSAVPSVCYNERVFALTGGRNRAEDVISDLTEHGLGYVRVCVGEDLSMPQERIVSGTAEELTEETFGDLSVMIIENDRVADRFRRMKDEDFERARVPMTKEPVRQLACAMLAVRPDDIVYDIGAGTGAMTCALAMKAYDSFVYAAEKKKEACSLTLANAERLGVRNIILAEGEAPAALDGFPAPDKVFIGGSAGNLEEIIGCVLGKNAAAKILVTAVTLQTLEEARRTMIGKGMAPEITCVNLSRAESLGRYDLMKAENPVWLIMGGVGEGETADA